LISFGQQQTALADHTIAIERVSSRFAGISGMTRYQRITVRGETTRTPQSPRYVGAHSLVLASFIHVIDVAS
jgi:hypothetical protein